MSVLTSPPKGFDFLESCQRAHQKHGYDFSTSFDHWFTNGYMFKSPEYLVMGGRDPDRPDAWLCWWAEVHPSAFSKSRLTAIKVFLSLVPYPLPYIGWARPSKGRVKVEYYSTTRLNQIVSGQSWEARNQQLSSKPRPQRKPRQPQRPLP